MDALHQLHNINRAFLENGATREVYRFANAKFMYPFHHIRCVREETRFNLISGAPEPQIEARRLDLIDLYRLNAPDVARFDHFEQALMRKDSRISSGQIDNLRAIIVTRARHAPPDCPKAEQLAAVAHPTS